MNSTALMLLLGLMGTAWSNPVRDPEMKHACGNVRDPEMKHECRDDCVLTPHGHHMPGFKQVPEFQNSSVAPWDLMVDEQSNREPQHIDYAKCRRCTVEGMTAKPIILQVTVFERICSGTAVAWCKCPFQLAVGCTCVSEQCRRGGIRFCGDKPLCL